MSLLKTDETNLEQNHVPTLRKPIRLWPGVVAAALLILVRFLIPLIAPEARLFGLPMTLFGVIGGILFGVAIIVWWLFFSRAPWSERLSAIGLMIVALLATSRIVHVSIATGAMGMLFPILAIPLLSLAFVVWVVASRHLADGLRRATMVATILLACGGWALVRTGGFTGNFDNDFAWRWSQTPEERLLAQAGDDPAETVQAQAPTLTGVDWPGFRGLDRDGVVRSRRIATDWSASPPVELWRRRIGPGWSSFAVLGDRLFTQEQRGSDEVVTCYNANTGKLVWTHRDAARFYESNGGAGPRATPMLSNGRVYTFGATGILNALDAGTGAVLWSRNAASDTNTKVPGWGFASSPLVLDDKVIIATAGTLAAYDLATGEPRWFGPQGGGGYSSPHRMIKDGITQIVLLSETGVTSVAPGDGKVLWNHALQSGTPIVQPALTSDGDLLVSNGEGTDIRRLAVTKGPEGWTVEERWKSYGLVPNFNDLVVHGDQAYGFDGGMLVCIDVKDGERKWEGGTYGYGQLVLLPDQDLLLVVAEKGDLALVGATPEQFKEFARIHAIKGKTWNHPVLAGDLLLVRNGEEMVAFRLSSQGS
jgi:outer membrane protein assembly factor BamB